METFYQDGKTPLGLDEYRMRNAEAIGQHWCLVFVAYALLPLDCLPPSPTKGSLPIKTIGEACRQQAQALIKALILYAHERLQLGQRAEDIFASLFAKQQTLMATSAIPGGRSNPVTTPTSQLAFRKHRCDNTSLTGTI